jgi:DNA polymerase-3 subunit beta
MEFSISRTLLLDCLSHFQSVVEKRNTIPILSNIKINAIEGGLNLTATDLAIELSESLAASVNFTGGVTIPSQLFFDIVRKAPDSSNITLKKDEKTSTVFLLFGDSKFSLPTLPTEDFPVMDSENLAREISINSNDLKILIDNTKFCMGLDESRQYLNGIYFHGNEDKVLAVATDGHRLSKCSASIKESNNLEGIIIPKKSVVEISKILDDYDGNVSISFSKTRIKLTFGSVVIVSKLINASFPDYESVIPTDNNQMMIVDCKSFSETIDRVSTISDEKLRTVKFEISSNNCTVSSFGNDKSIGTESVKVEYSGPQISINFNAKYILDVLSIVKNGKVKFHFSEKTAPTIIESETIKNNIFLIMQMRA